MKVSWLLEALFLLHLQVFANNVVAAIAVVDDVAARPVNVKVDIAFVVVDVAAVAANGLAVGVLNLMLLLLLILLLFLLLLLLICQHRDIMSTFYFISRHRSSTNANT